MRQSRFVLAEVGGQFDGVWGGGGVCDAPLDCGCDVPKECGCEAPMESC